MRDPMPKPGHKNNTAKFAVEFSDGLTVTGYLFTNGIAPAKSDVVPGYAWVGGNLTLPGTKLVARAPGRAGWQTAASAIRRMAGHPAKFTTGTVTVKANPAHGTRQASVQFGGPFGSLLSALEDAMALAGWTLITGGQGTKAERQILADAGLRDPELACTGHEPEPTDCEPACAALPGSWRATADQLGNTTQDVALAFALRRCADELDAVLPTP